MNIVDHLFDFESEEQQKEAIRFLISHNAWRGFFIPKLLDIQQKATGLLLDPSEERKAKDPDDFLRAIVMVCERLITLGPAEVREWEVNQLQEADEYQPIG
jgi:hypothetical protein